MPDGILVLGAAGFIGRCLAEHLAVSGHQVMAATREPALFEHPAITNVVAPFDLASHYTALLRDCGAIIHAASDSTPGSSEAQPQLDGNLRPTLALIEAMQAMPDRRLVYLSSGGTLYGDRDRPAREDDPMRPRSYHGAGKGAAELFIHAWSTQYAGTAVVLRPSNVYGAGQPPRPGFGIIPAAFDCARRRVPLTVWGGGDTVRDFLYVDDLAALCASALDHPLSRGTHVFNASCNRGVTVDVLLDAIDTVTGRPLQRDYLLARRVDVQRIIPDNSAARHTFGWQPSTTLEQGLSRTWDWFTTRA